MTRFASISGVRIHLAVLMAPLMLLGVDVGTLAAQVFEVGGGNSSLYQAGGGSITMQSKGYEFTVGAGSADGRLLEGGRVMKPTPQGTYVLGDDRIDFRLPTDIFDTSHFLLARGIGFNGIRHDLDIVAFAGMMSVAYDSPFFSGARLADPTAIFFMKGRLNDNWVIFSDTVISKKITQIESLQWTPSPRTEMSFAAGVGADQFFGAGSIKLERPVYDLRAAYMLAGQNFHRVATATPELAEPDRLNVSMTVRPYGFMSLTGSHQNYLVPITTSAINPVNTANGRSSIDQGSISLHLLGTQLNGTAYHSTYRQASLLAASNHATAISIDRDFGRRLRWNSNFLVSKPARGMGNSSLISSLSEDLNSRISVTESVTYSNGRSSVNFGGQFLSNILSLSASYDTFYVPANNAQPFEQALLLDLKLKVLGRMLLHGASFVDPTGQVRYTADANSVFTHERIPKPVVYASLGKYVLHGCVVDSDGAPVEGAAVTIDEAPLFTDSNGCFNMRESSPRTHRLRVVMSDFLAGGNWQVVTEPTTVTSTTEDKSEEMRVIVVVRKVREISANREPPQKPPA